MSEKLHVLICPHCLDYGGSQLSVHHWAKFLDPARFRVSVLAMRPGGLSAKFESYYDVFYDAPGYPNIRDFIRRLRPDIVHACPPGGKPMGYIERAAALTTVTQTVMCPRPAANTRHVAMTVVPSDYVLSLQPPGYPVVKIDHPFDMGDYRQCEVRREFGLPDDKVIIGSFGNDRKENDHFFEIARRCRCEDVHFVIKARPTLRRLMKRRNLTVISRSLDEEEKIGLFRCFDVFLYPTSNEAYGIVFLEAMAQGCPVISYDDAANKEVIGPGGLFASYGDLEGMLSHLKSLVNDPRHRRRLGQAGRNLVRQRNDPRLIARHYAAMLDGALTMAERRPVGQGM